MCDSSGNDEWRGKENEMKVVGKTMLCSGDRIIHPPCAVVHLPLVVYGGSRKGVLRLE